jgi:hypothetical protein
LQAKKNSQALVLLEVREDAEIETLPFVSDSQQGINLLKILKRAKNMSEIRNMARKYLFGDQGTEKFSEIVEGYKKRVVGTLINAVKYSKMLHTQR